MGAEEGASARWEMGEGAASERDAATFGAGVQSAGYRLAGLARLAERRVGLVQSRLGLLAFGWVSEAPRGHG